MVAPPQSVGGALENWISFFSSHASPPSFRHKNVLAAPWVRQRPGVERVSTFFSAERFFVPGFPLRPFFSVDFFLFSLSPPKPNFCLS